MISTAVTRESTPMRHFRHRIVFSPSAYQTYCETMAQQPPETVALLGGRLSKPFDVTDFRLCPPLRCAAGYDESSVHVNVDPDYMNWVVDRELRPNGRDMLGIMHSHPAGHTSLSRGDPESNTGDIVFFTSCLDNDDSPERNWRYFLAPVVTFWPDGSDEITGWVLKRGSTRPVRAEVVIEPGAGERGATSGPQLFTFDDLRIEITRDLLVSYTARLAPLCQDPHLEHHQRQAKLDELARLTDAELRNCLPSHYLLSKIIKPSDPEPW